MALLRTDSVCIIERSFHSDDYYDVIIMVEDNSSGPLTTIELFRLILRGSVSIR